MQRFGFIIVGVLVIAIMSLLTNSSSFGIKNVEIRDSGRATSSSSVVVAHANSHQVEAQASSTKAEWNSISKLGKNIWPRMLPGIRCDGNDCAQVDHCSDYGPLCVCDSDGTGLCYTEPPCDRTSCPRGDIDCPEELTFQVCKCDRTGTGNCYDDSATEN